MSNGVSWVIVFTNGAVAYSRREDESDAKFDHFEFEEFATRNFACDFGLIEETKREDTPAWCRPLSAPVSRPERDES
jgi:hypothetical protein